MVVGTDLPDKARRGRVLMEEKRQTKRQVIEKRNTYYFFIWMVGVGEWSVLEVTGGDGERDRNKSLPATACFNALSLAFFSFMAFERKMQKEKGRFWAEKERGFWACKTLLQLAQLPTSAMLCKAGFHCLCFPLSPPPLPPLSPLLDIPSSPCCLLSTVDVDPCNDSWS